MKRIVLGVAVLMMMAGTAFGVSYTVTSGGMAEKLVAPGETFTVVISLDPAGNDPNLSAWQISMVGPAGYKIAAAPGSGGYDPGVAAGWDKAQGLTAWQGAAFPKDFSVSQGPIGTVAVDVDNGIALAGPVFQFDVIAPSDPAAIAGEITLISARYGTIYFEEFDAESVAGLSLIVPEPVSALLLLAGLPMLRRRR